MSNTANATLEMEGAGIPASAMPTARIDSSQHKVEEKAMFGADATVSAADQLDGDIEPTDEEFATLRKIAAPMKWTTILLCLIEFAERASYYGSRDCFSNFVRGPLPKGGNGAGAVPPGPAGENLSAGALGMGSVSASAVKSTFGFLSYVFPIVGAIIADTKWGRFKTLCVGTAIGAFAHILLVVPAIPSVISAGMIGSSATPVAFVPFILSVLILSGAAGLIKPCLGPLLCDQSPVKRPIIKTMSNGERVIVDPQTTVSRYLQIFYVAINVGAMFSIATSYAERLVGFWLAYLLPGIIYMIMPFVLWFLHKRMYLAPPQGSVLVESYQVMKLAIKRSGWIKAMKGGDDFWNVAKPSYIEATEGQVDRSKVFWDDLFVDEIRQSVLACGVFFIIPIFQLADGGIGNSLNTQSAAMVLNNIPNDIMGNFNPLTIIIASPIITYGLYPVFEKIGRPIKPMTRMAIGFLLGSINCIFAAIVQWKVYQTSPCGWMAGECDEVSAVSLAWQIPMFVIPAVGEIFVNVTSYELAYTRAPARMKGLIYAICLFASAISYAIQLALSKVITDPYLIWPWVALAVACFVSALLFPTVFKHLDKPLRSFADPARQEGKEQPAYSSKAIAHEEGLEDEKARY